MQAFADIIILLNPRFTKPLIVDIDASDFENSAVLSQVNKEDKEQPVGYLSPALSKTERRYSITQIEILALVDLLQYFRFYILGRN